VGMSLVTSLSRHVVYLWPGDYASFEPDRYFIAQNMMAAGLVGFGLARLLTQSRRWAQSGAWGLVCLSVGYVVMQREHLAHYPVEEDRLVLASRRWPTALARTRALIQLTGDGALARTVAAGQAENRPRALIPINVEGHEFPVSLTVLEALGKDGGLTDAVPCAAASTLGLALSGKPVPMAEARWSVVPRAAGLLITGQVAFRDLRGLRRSGRRVWLTGAPVGAVLSAELLTAEKTPTHRVLQRQGRRWLDAEVRVRVWLPGVADISALHPESWGLAVGETPETPLLLALGAAHPCPLRWSALLSDASLGLPVGEALFGWQHPAEGLRPQGFSRTEKGFFEFESPQPGGTGPGFLVESVGGEVGVDQVCGIHVRLRRVLGPVLPPSLVVVLHGTEDQRVELTLASAEDDLGWMRSYRVEHLPPSADRQGWRVRRLEVQCPDLAVGSIVRPDAVILRAPPADISPAGR
jgi:hypothetical protein